RSPGVFAALLVFVAGCQRDEPPPAKAVPAQSPAAGPALRVVMPERKSVSRPIEQPGFNIEPFEETPLYPRVSGYVGKWHKDIGASVKEGEVLAELDVPEMLVDLRQKEATIRQALAQVGQARAAVQAAQAQLTRAKSQYERLARLGKGGVLDKENIAEMLL